MAVKLDQHMMVDEGIIKRIAESAELKAGDVVLEIGAGSGNLTRKLANTQAKVISIELDIKFRKDLEGIMADILWGDALELIDKLRFSKMVANLPYAICEPLFQKLIFINFELAVLTVPESFAENMLAGETKPGIMAREFFEIKKLFEVPGKAFSPAPKTLSAVLLLRPRKEKTLFALVLQQQKMMVKNAIMRALFLRQKTTKNEARKALKTLKLNNKLAEKRVRELNSNELLAVREVL